MKTKTRKGLPIHQIRAKRELNELLMSKKSSVQKKNDCFRYKGKQDGAKFDFGI